jgi:hypothetical protein
MKEIVCLRVSDEFVIFIPPENKKSPLELKETREQLLNRFKKIVTYDFSKTTKPAERESYWEAELRSREIARDGQVGHEFHVKVISYPERDEMSRSPMQGSEINYLLNPQTGAGLSIQLIGYAGSCLLKLYHLPFVEVYTPRVDGESSYVQCGLTKSKKDNIRASFLARELFETKGDALAYVGVLIDYYRTCNTGLQTTISAHSKAATSKQEQIQEESVNRVRDCIFGDISDAKIKEYADTVDRLYEDAFGDCIDFSHYTGGLITDDINVQLYNKLKSEFPFVHLVMYSMVQSKRFKETGPVDSNQLHAKQRMMLFLFFGLICTRSQRMMKHWAIVEPLANFYRGHSQPGAKTVGGAFVSTLETSFLALDEIYGNKYPDFMSTIEEQQTAFVSFDNYQKNISKKNQTAHKAALTHIGTSYYIKAPKPIRISKHSSVTTDLGLKFKVQTCKRFNDDKW